MNGPDAPNSKIRRDEYAGTVYVVSTPIGNMEDITLRALRILKTVDMIAAESVKHTQGLCKYHQIKTRVTRYNQHNHHAKAPELISMLKAGRNIALVTDAGTPGISDPGVHLIRSAMKERISFTPIPGPSAVTAALSVSGFPSEQFVFLGFLPNKAGKRRKRLEGLTTETRTMVFFEAPHRVRDMLEDLGEILGDRQVVMAREITKIFEDLQEGAISQILDHLTPDTTRGEFTLVVAGAAPRSESAFDLELHKRIQRLLNKNGGRVKDIAKMLSTEENLPYRRVYKECIAVKQRLDKGFD